MLIVLSIVTHISNTARPKAALVCLYTCLLVCRPSVHLSVAGCPGVRHSNSVDLTRHKVTMEGLHRVHRGRSARHKVTMEGLNRVHRSHCHNTKSDAEQQQKNSLGPGARQRRSWLGSYRTSLEQPRQVQASG